MVLIFLGFGGGACSSPSFRASKALFCSSLASTNNRPSTRFATCLRHAKDERIRLQGFLKAEWKREKKQLHGIYGKSTATLTATKAVWMGVKGNRSLKTYFGGPIFPPVGLDAV